MSKWSDEETDEPLMADNRNFYKVETWTKDGSKIERMLSATWTRRGRSSRRQSSIDHGSG